MVYNNLTRLDHSMSARYYKVVRALLKDGDYTDRVKLWVNSYDKIIISAYRRGCPIPHATEHYFKLYKLFKEYLDDKANM